MTISRVLTMTKDGHGQTQVFKQVCGRALIVVAEAGKLAVGVELAGVGETFLQFSGVFRTLF
jgi:hypothetical protein